MAKKNQPGTPKMEWIDPKGELTQDQWLCVHLLFYTNSLSLKYGMIKGSDRPDITRYMEKAARLLKMVSSKAPDSKNTTNIPLAKALKEANDSLCDIYINVNNEHSESSEYTKFFYLRPLEHIVNYVKENLSDIVFSEFFTDIFYDDKGVYSLMAANILDTYIRKMKDAQDREEDLDEEEISELRKVAYMVFRENWKESRPELMKISLQRGVLFHALSLMICHKCLDRELYATYQMCVVEAVTAYKGKTDSKKKNLALRKANDEFASLMMKVLVLIKKGIDDTKAYEPKNEFFALATDYCIGLVTEIEPMYATAMLNDITVKYDDIVAHERVESYVNNTYNHIIVECAKIYSEAMSDEDDDDLDADEDYDDLDADEDYDDEDYISFEEELAEVLRRSWDTVRDRLTDMPMACVHLAHLIILASCYHLLTKEQFARYHDAVVKAHLTCRGNSSPKQKEQALHGANEALAELKEKMFEEILSEEDLEEEEIDDELSFQRDIFTLTVDNILLFVNKHLDKYLALGLIKATYLSKDTFRVHPEIDMHALEIAKRSLEELEVMYKQLGEGAEDEDEMNNDV